VLESEKKPVRGKDEASCEKVIMGSVKFSMEFSVGGPNYFGRLCKAMTLYIKHMGFNSLFLLLILFL